MTSGSSVRPSPVDSATKDCPRCRTRRIACDRTLPHCRKCISRNFVCPGYGIVLRWAQGVASRGKLAGRAIPLHGESDKPNGLSIAPQLQVFDTVSSELLRHFNSGVASKLAWVDGPANPWRHIILPLSHVSPTVLSSVLAIAAQDLTSKYTPDHPYLRRLRMACFHYLGQALSSLRQQLGALRRSPGSPICPSQARCLLASTLLLYNLELLNPEAARWQLHIQGARAIIQEAIRCPDSLEEADVFLFYEYYYACVFIGLTTFDPTDGSTPSDIPTHDRITIFSDFVRITHSVTKVERVKFTTGSNPQPYTLRLDAVRAEIELAKQRTLHLSQAIPFSSPTAQRDFAHLTCMYYHASLIYSHQVLADDASAQEATRNIRSSREAILDHLDHLTQRTFFTQDLVWPLFMAGTECRGLPDKQGLIERAMLDVMRVSGSLDRRRVLSFLQMFWRQDLGRYVNWIHFARTMSSGGGFLIL
ncbi:fungal-specific transcription factor domain-containing protein [Aspergillus ambiguus]|uniref:Zn(II)2Cys6 transcription factor n=1 Tax=Aspergillus ambiguus TaxID=176160 RepID=UPI003CCD6968